jgi:hypothetical protein
MPFHAKFLLFWGIIVFATRTYILLCCSSVYFKISVIVGSCKAQSEPALSGNWSLRPAPNSQNPNNAALARTMTDNAAIIAAIRKVNGSIAATDDASEATTVDPVPPGYTLDFGPSDGASNAAGVSDIPGIY